MSDSKLNKFKEKLFHQEAPVDNDALWAALEPHIPQTKKRRVLPFWMLFGFLSLAAILIWVVINKNAKVDVESNNSLNIATLNESNLNDISQAVTFENKNVALDAANDNDPKTAEIGIQSFEKNTTIISREAKKIVSKEKNLELYNGIDNIPSSDLKQKEINLLKNQLPAQQPVDVSSDLELMSAKVGDLNSTINSLPSLRIKQLVKKSFIDFDFIKPDRSTFIKSYWIKPQVITGISKATYQTNNSEKGLAGHWNKHTQTLPNLGLSMLVGADISRKWSLFTGLEYTRFTSRITLDRNSTFDSSVPGTVKTIIDENGNISLLTGDLSTTTIENYKARWHTYNHIISIPLGVEYYLVQKKRNNVKLILGANIKVADYQSGSILNEALTIDKFDFKNSPYQISPFSFYLGSEVEYMLKENLSIGIGMNLRYNQNEILVQDIILKEELRTLNTYLSLKHIF